MSYGVFVPMKRTRCIFIVFVVSLALIVVSVGAIPRSTNVVSQHPTESVAGQMALPGPTGPDSVGTTVFHFADPSRPDAISKKPGESREVMVQIWYPSSAPAPAAAPYIPDPAVWRAIAAVEGGYYSQSAATVASWKDLRTHSSWNAPVRRADHRFPLVLFSPGLGITRSNYTAFSEELASHGYIVASMDNPYGGLTVLPDGKILSADDDPTSGDEGSMPAHLELYVGDAVLVIRELEHPQKNAPVQFADSIDFGKIGMFGHSLGGAAALEGCRSAEQFKACVDLDGAPFGKVLVEGVQKPVMLLLESPDYSDVDLAAKSRTREQSEEMGRKGNAMWAKVASNKRAVPVYKVKIRGTGHLSFSDAPFVMPDTITRFGGRILDPQTTFDRITVYLLAFFDHYLKGKPDTLLSKSPSPFPEVSVERLDAGR
jgi:dienelactone hydrolase